MTIEGLQEGTVRNLLNNGRKPAANPCKKFLIDGGKLRDRNFNRDDRRPNDRYGNNRNNRNFNQKDGRGGGYRSDRAPMDRDRNNQGGPPHRQDHPRGERREFNRDSRDIEERMPKYKPVEGAVSDVNHLILFYFYIIFCFRTFLYPIHLLVWWSMIRKSENSFKICVQQSQCVSNSCKYTFN